MKKTINRGFTIVELLVVIVVIGILAAITMVSYSGITTKASTTAAQANAASVKQVIETFYADNGTNAGNGSWPANAAAVTTYSGTATALAKLPASITLSAGTVALNATNGKTTVTYMPLATPANGGCIAYFNFSDSSLDFMFLGQAKAATEGTNTTAGQIATCTTV